MSKCIAVVLGLFLLASCSPMATTITLAGSARPAFDARLRALSVNPVIQRAAAYRLSIGSPDPEALATAVRASTEAPESVRAVLQRDVDDVVIVDWLVSFGAMGAWTAYNPRNTESVNIPVSDVPGLVAGSPQGGIYRLRDQKHLMLVWPVVVGDQAVGAVGFVLAQTSVDSALESEAAQLH